MVYKDKDRRASTLGEGDALDQDFDPNTMQFHSILMSAKAKVTPLRIGLTIPRSELSGLVLGTRLQVRISKHYKPGIGSAIMLGDSTCVISSMSKNSNTFSPFFHSRISECIRNRDIVADHVGTQEEIFHLPSKENISDLATRRSARVGDCQMGTIWQCGPSWLRTPRNTWPVSRDFDMSTVPKEETKGKIRIISPTISLTVKPDQKENFVKFVLETARDYNTAVLKLV